MCLFDGVFSVFGPPVMSVTPATRLEMVLDLQLLAVYVSIDTLTFVQCILAIM